MIDFKVRLSALRLQHCRTKSVRLPSSHCFIKQMSSNTIDVTNATENNKNYGLGEKGIKTKKVDELNDGRTFPPYYWKNSLSDWWKQEFTKDYTDEKVEARLLSFLPFFPKSDGKRKAEVINTDIGDGNSIHELFIENIETPDPNSAIVKSGVKDIVLVHGYAASLGLFIHNFDSISSIPGVRIHAVDLLGFGLSSRPNFPKFKNQTKEDIYEIENWFIDSLDEWRRRRGIDRFVLIGHSFGGYLSCAYAMKYNQNLVNASTGVSQRMIEKLILLSPVGVERNRSSLLANQPTPPSQVDQEQREKENSENHEVNITQELNADQESIVNGEHDKAWAKETAVDTKSKKTIRWLWERNVSPFSIVRKSGPIRSKMISRWTTFRFAHVYYQNPEHFQNIHDYFYRIFNGEGSGEFAITRVLSYGALARLPLLDRVPEKFAKMGLPSLWVYGDKDWMNEEAGFEMTKEINQLTKQAGKGELASYAIIKNAGHHLYLDNPPDFAKTIFNFLGY